MIVNAYLNVTKKQLQEIKDKYVDSNMYHVISSSRRKNKRCEDCVAYNPCTSYEGYCFEEEGLVDACETCEKWHE